MSSCQALPCCDAELSDPLRGASPRLWDEKRAVTFRTRSVEEVREIVRRMRANKHFGKIVLVT